MLQFMGPLRHWRFERGAICRMIGNLRATCPWNRRLRPFAVCSCVDSAMVRRARLQNAPAEEFVDRGRGKLKCIEGVSEGGAFVALGSEASFASICVEQEPPRIGWK